MNARAVVDVGDRVAACLLGGAIGDALGAGIEFSSIEEITRVHGPDGVTDYVEAYGRRGAITDDTQMTLFTTEGIIRASVRYRSRGICHPPSVVRHAYIRWFLSQGERWNDDDFTAAGGADGWLIDVEGLHRRRAPGNTCLGAMAKGGDGTIDRPINDSKGCGGVMRAAPAGFVAADARFGLGCEIAALTHGHPSGYLPAGFLAATVGALLDGDSLGAALDTAERQLVGWRDHDETLAAVRAGRRLGESGHPISPEDLEQLGGGWTGEEALAISIACAVSADSFHDRSSASGQPFGRLRLDRIDHRQPARCRARFSRTPAGLARRTRASRRDRGARRRCHARTVRRATDGRLRRRHSAGGLVESVSGMVTTPDGSPSQAQTVLRR